MNNIKLISLSELKESPYQGRLIDTQERKEGATLLTSLISSIEQNGLMNPVVVRETDNGYEIIDGHRRVEAYRQMGREKIECRIKNYSDKEAQVMSVVGNLQRQELSSIEKAIAFKKVLNRGIFKNKQELSTAIGMDQTYVGDMINAVNMDQRIIDDLLTNKTTSDMRLLRAIRLVEKTDENQYSEKQWQLYQQFKNEGLTREEVQVKAKVSRQKPGKNYTVVQTPRRIHINLSEKLPRAKREMIQKMLEEKMEEIMKLV